MLYTIQNDRFTASVNDLGAELWSLRDRRSGREYIWQGDARYWTGRSPVLFPIVGRLKDDAYLVNGRQYRMKKHGFARGGLLCARAGRGRRPHHDAGIQRADAGPVSLPLPSGLG